MRLRRPLTRRSRLRWGRWTLVLRIVSSRRAEHVVQRLEGHSIDRIDVVWNMALAILEPARLKASIAPPGTDLLTADKEVCTVGSDAAWNKSSYVAIEVPPLCRTNGNLVGVRHLFFAGIV